MRLLSGTDQSELQRLARIAGAGLLIAVFAVLGLLLGVALHAVEPSDVGTNAFLWGLIIGVLIEVIGSTAVLKRADAVLKQVRKRADDLAARVRELEQPCTEKDIL